MGNEAALGSTLRSRDPGLLKHLNRLLATALELEPEQREAWLRGLHEEPAELVAMVRDMLANEPGGDADTFLSPPVDLAQRALEEPQREDQPGDCIGPYRLIEALGEGGMASVWLAELADRTIERQVALKIPHAQWADRGLAKRISREWAVLASLNHPNIAQLYDAGWSDSGRPYLALEVVRGEPIDRACAKLDIPARVRLFIDVLRAVAYAHARLVVHRDLKPGNVLVTAEGQVKLLDFGIAKVLESDTQKAVDTVLTQMGGRPLTLAYAAPEQVVQGADVTTATDIYSLGAMLFELLCGERACQPKDTAPGAIYDAILRGTPPLPSSRVADKVQARQLRGDLDSIVLKALSKAPELRYETAIGFADDLERYLDGRVVLARRSARAYRLQRFVARNMGTVLMVLAVGVALLVGLTVAVLQAREAERMSRLAAVERDRAVAAAERREALNAFMRDLLLEAGRSGKPVKIDQLVARAYSISTTEFASNPELRAAVLDTVGAFRIDMDGPENALPYFDKALALLTNSKDAGLRASVGCSRALIWGSEGHYSEARKSIEALVNAADTPIDSRIDCHQVLADLAVRSSDTATSRQNIQVALDEWAQSPRRSPFQHVRLLETLAQTTVPDEHPAQSEAILDQALRELQQLGRENGSFGDVIREERVAAVLFSGDPRRALELTDEALKILGVSNPNEPPVFLLYDRGLILSALGRHTEALHSFRRMAAIAKPFDQQYFARALYGIACELSRLGQERQSEEAYREATLVGSAATSEQLIRKLLTRARLDLDRGRYHASRGGLERILQMPGCPSDWREMSLLLRAEADLGDHDAAAAIRDGQAALKLGVQLRGGKPYSVWVGKSELSIGKAQGLAGDISAARTSLDQAVKDLSAGLGDSDPLTREAQAAAKQS